MEEIEITMKHAATIWWAIFWRSILMAFATGIVAGIVIGIIGGILRTIIKPESTIAFMVGLNLVSIIAGLSLGIYVTIRVIKRIIAYKQFNGFRIALIATNNSYTNKIK